jgi:DNA-binding transcriptional ArsR family regulator
MMEELQIPEKIEITSIETLKAVSDPLRMDILKQVGIANRKGDRVTVKELGKMLDLPPTKLYYHVNLLEEHELLVVGETKIVSGIIEKHYQVCAMSINVSKDLMALNETEDREGQLADVLHSIEELVENTIQNMKTSMQTIFAEAKREKEEGIPAREQLQMDVRNNEIILTREQAEAYMAKLNAVHEEYAKISDQNLHAEDGEALYFGVTHLIVPLYHRTKNPNQPE